MIKLLSNIRDYVVFMSWIIGISGSIILIFLDKPFSQIAGFITVAAILLAVTLQKN